MALGLFKIAKKVITKVDELMHIHACIDISRKFVGDNWQRKEVLIAAATVSEGPSAIDCVSKCHIANHQRESINDNDEDDDGPLQQELPTTHATVKSILEMEDVDCYKEEEEEKKEALQSLLNHSRESKPELEPNDVVPELELVFAEG